MKQSHERGYEKAMTDVRACDEGRKKWRWRTPPVPQDLRSNRAGNLAAISPDESPLSHEFRAKYRGKAIFCFCHLADAERPFPRHSEPRRDPSRTSAALPRVRVATRPSSPRRSEQLERTARRPPPRARSARAPSGNFGDVRRRLVPALLLRLRARTARGRLGVGGGPRLAFLCVSGTTRARARGSRPAPAPRRAPTRCPSRPPGRTDGAPGPFQRGLRVHRRGRLGVARLRPEVAARSVADELRRSRARDRRGDGPHRRG